MVPEGDLWGAPRTTCRAKGLLLRAAPGRAKGSLQGCFYRSYPWGRLWYVQPVDLETLGEGISDLRDLSWERCFKSLYLLLLMCA